MVMQHEQKFSCAKATEKQIEQCAGVHELRITGVVFETPGLDGAWFDDALVLRVRQICTSHHDLAAALLQFTPMSSMMLTQCCVEALCILAFVSCTCQLWRFLSQYLRLSSDLRHFTM